MLMDTDHRQHCVQEHSGRLHSAVAFDVVNGDAGIHQPRRVFESRVVVHFSRSLKITDLIGEQFMEGFFAWSERVLRAGNEVLEQHGVAKAPLEKVASA